MEPTITYLQHFKGETALGEDETRNIKVFVLTDGIFRRKKNGRHYLNMF